MTPEQIAAALEGVVQIEDDGDLSMGEREYAGWFAGEERVCLDGDFSADELEAIVAHMRRVTQEKQK